MFRGTSIFKCHSKLCDNWIFGSKHSQSKNENGNLKAIFPKTKWVVGYYRNPLDPPLANDTLIVR